MVTKTEAIKNFLAAKAPPDLAALYNIEMECQVNVAQDGGERTDGEFRGRKWHGWTDGSTTWKSFRIPYKADSEPEWDDKEQRFDLAKHVEGIGMTGWNWTKRLSEFVAFDFDAILGHSEKHQKVLTNEQLDEVRERAAGIDWVTVRRSASGKGLHLYVFLEGVSTQNHTEHASLARAVLGKMSALVGYDFQSKVDICGGNMWVWHRKAAGTNGLTLIKQGKTLPAHEVPANWRDHIHVVTRKRKKNLPQNIDKVESFEELCGQNPRVDLDEGHQKLIHWLKENDAFWWFDQDHWMLVSHTVWLKRAHEKLGLRGIFHTSSPGTNIQEQNCFAYPMRNGAWSIRRYGPGTSEHSSWEQDGTSWTRCYYNRDADLHTASRATGGLEDPSGGFQFPTARDAVNAARMLGVTVNIGQDQQGHKTKLRQHKDGRLIVEMDHKEGFDRADDLQGWLLKKGKWLRMYAMQRPNTDEDAGKYDDLMRHLVTSSNEDSGWVIKSDETWRQEPYHHVKTALGSMGFNEQDVKKTMGSSIFRPWLIVNKPFQPEYPGDREWNRNAAQFKFVPSRDKDDLKYPTWTKILKHVGAGLDEAVKNDHWCKANGILTGGDYLKCWVASLFQEPTEPLPYLALYGPQNSGKSILHEALSLLLTKGYQRADAALVSTSNFNGELEGALICVIEETALSKNKQAYNRIKDYVTSREILVHRKQQTPYHSLNCTHWIQCTNEHTDIPVFTGDTRITMIYVDSLDPLDLIPKKQLIPMLEKEASDFLAEILRLEVPPSPDRLNVPCLATQDKIQAEIFNETPLETFMRERCVYATGRMIKFSEVYLAYQEWCEANGEVAVGNIKFGRELPTQYPKARAHENGQVYIGNAAWKGMVFDTPAPRKLFVKDGYLEEMPRDA